jgi:hypothetical protein
MAADDRARLGSEEHLGRARGVVARAIASITTVPLAGAPYLLTEVGRSRFVASGAGQRPHEAEGVRPRQGFERERGHVRLSLQLGEHPLDDRRVDQILLARRDHQEERRGVESAGDEGQQADAHLVRPVEVFEDQCGRVSSEDVPEQHADPLEKHQVVRGRGRVAVPG